MEFPISNEIGFAFRDTEVELANNFSAAVDDLKKTWIWHTYKNSLLGHGMVCNEETGSEVISLESMSGALGIFFCCFLLACVGGCIAAAGVFKGGEDEDSKECLMTEGEMLRKLVDNQPSLETVGNDTEVLKQLLANQSSVVDSLRVVQRLVAETRHAQEALAAQGGPDLDKQFEKPYGMLSLPTLPTSLGGSGLSHTDDSSGLPLGGRAFTGCFTMGTGGDEGELASPSSATSWGFSKQQGCE